MNATPRSCRCPSAISLVTIIITARPYIPISFHLSYYLFLFTTAFGGTTPSPFLVAIHCPKLHDASWWLLAIGRWFLLLMLLWLLLLLPGFVNLDPETRNTHTHSHIYTPAHHTDTIYNSNTITNTCARPECFWQTHLEHLLHLLRRLPHFNCFCSHHTTTVASD